jgi:formamidopyrimidine-DNA glycosylase
MPELPDVEIFKRLAERHGAGRIVARVSVCDPAMVRGVAAEELPRRLEGRRISACRRHGKVLFLEIEGDGALALHFGMNGALRYVARGEGEPGYVRVTLGLGEGDALAYLNPRRIGEVRLVESAARFIEDGGLGPDALDPALDRAAFDAALGDGRQAIKTVLMDQARIAGIGNIYSDEILFQAKLHPALDARALDKRARARLHAAMRQVLETAIACGAGAETFTGTLPKDFLIPERRRGGRCPRCGREIQMLKIGGRTGYYCPRCQKEPRA